MNKRETTEILALLKVAYPQSFSKLTQTDLQVMVNLWQRQFDEYEQKEVARAVDAIISSDTNAFAPTIAKVKEMISKIRAPHIGIEIEAWNCVRNAIRRSSWWSEEEFEKLDEDLQKLIGSPSVLREWATMSSEQIETVVASNFQRSYKAYIAKKEEFIMLPSYIKKNIGIETEERVKIE